MKEVRLGLNNYDKSLQKSTAEILDKKYVNKSQLKNKENTNQLIEVPLCRHLECLEKTVRITQLDIIGSIYNKVPTRKKCVICGSPAKQCLLLGTKWKGEK